MMVKGMQACAREHHYNNDGELETDDSMVYSRCCFGFKITEKIYNINTTEATHIVQMCDSTSYRMH